MLDLKKLEKIAELTYHVGTALNIASDEETLQEAMPSLHALLDRANDDLRAAREFILEELAETVKVKLLAV